MIDVTSTKSISISKTKFKKLKKLFRASKQIHRATQIYKNTKSYNVFQIGLNQKDDLVFTFNYRQQYTKPNNSNRATQRIKGLSAAPLTQNEK